MPKLVYTEGEDAGKEFEFHEGEIVLGRRDNCDVILNDGLASGNHAKLFVENDKWTLKDLDSTNGTLLNMQPVTSSVMKEGDIIQIGNVRLMFKEDEAVTPPEDEISTPAEEQKEEAQEKEEPGKPQKPRAPVPAKTVEKSVPATKEDLALVEKMRDQTELIRREVSKIIVGQHLVLNQMLMCMIAGGHALLIGMPGMAKTLMVSTIAQVLDLKFKRVQFTPDLMPTDIIGTDILETNKETNEKEFRFMPGPIFCNLLLADEINRTPPKTQAALLEAMQEKRITVGTTTYNLDAPFFVLATQNPIEQEGTYPLPEAQMDRFMFTIWVNYPEEGEEEEIVSSTTVTQKVQPEKVLSKEQVIQLQQVVRKIPVSEHVIKYSIRLVRATRPGNDKPLDFIKEYVSLGAGPRAGQFLILAAKANAVLEGRVHVSCQDIKNAAIPVLRHRIYTNFAADSEGLTSMALVEKLLEAVKEPNESDYA